MDPDKIEGLNLLLAWQRTKLDRPFRAFYTHQRLIPWVEQDVDGWLQSIRTRLNDGFVPHPALICKVPKPGWLVRPGSVLDEQDEVVLNSLIGSFHQKTIDLLGKFQGDPDIAYQLRSSPETPDWIRTGVHIWTEWREKSTQKLGGSQFVVFADIAGFYENIDIARLRSDLSLLNPEVAYLELLMKLLNRWAQPRGRGIPQGFSASDILAKIYLNPVDRALRNEGFVHLRYVDDVRIFCKSRLEAKSGLLLLNELCRQRGLNLQSAKTKIKRADEAAHEIDGVSPVINSISSAMLTELRTFSAISTSFSLADLKRHFETHPENIAKEVLEHAFQDFFGTGSDDFNKTLLHYLLTRLAKANSRIAVAYAVDLLAQRPEETEPALRYLEEVGITEQDEQQILKYTSSPDAIYDYQLHQILEWFSRIKSYPEQLVRLCRQWTFDKNRDLWLRTAARAVLGEVGDQSDLEAIESSYETFSGELEKADIVGSLARMEKGRRNSLFGRITSDGELVKRSIAYVKNLSP